MTDAGPADDVTPLEGDALAAQTNRATVDGSSVTVNLSNSWRSGGELVVVLRNVETAIPRSLPKTATMEDSGADGEDLPYHNYTISVKSKRSGRLDTLDPVSIDHDGDDPDGDGQSLGDDATPEERAKLPIIRVGNILGLVLGDPNLDGPDNDDDDSTTAGLQYHGPDQVKRDFTITPATVYQGETNKTFRVSFTAGGPMYAIGEGVAKTPVVITLGIPTELQQIDVGLTKDNISVITRGPVSPGGRLDVAEDDPIEEVNITTDGWICCN